MNNHVFNDTLGKMTVSCLKDDETIYHIKSIATGNLICEVPMQIGPADVVGVNGVTLQALVAICINRLQKLNEPPNNTVTQRQTLNHLTSALLMLETEAMEQSKET